MSIISKSFYLIAWLQIIHSAVSSFEFHQVVKHIILENPDAQTPGLPVDIKLEAICGLIFFIVGKFVSYSKITHLTIRGEERIIEANQYLKLIALNKASNTDVLTNSDPYGEINYHPAFVDIHYKRKAYKEYINRKA
ncbi:unnamed protein product [Kluyveromyces dobzhanskii CBS 2104]|uniref:WGS project CCBQ000000000 data, contig 00058 n=1 Tax=Kluyveromyces dobzhanskii CBS 2104 TaxID=1427455 RepID=A0A0A8LDS8_9SACH|nr:unnamed protein product [Kluyveromyces dobzhanskii CBS 2104]